MSLSIFNLPRVQNWVKNIQNGMDKYFWDEAIYHLQIYESFNPLMRFVVDMKIEGKPNREIAEMTGKSESYIENIANIAKGRLKKGFLSMED